MKTLNVNRYNKFNYNNKINIECDVYQSFIRFCFKCNEIFIRFCFKNNKHQFEFFKFDNNDVIAFCYGLFILLIEYVSMDSDSARHASGLAPHTVYSLADFQFSNHINYYLFNHTLCSLHYTLVIYSMSDTFVKNYHIYEHHHI